MLPSSRSAGIIKFLLVLLVSVWALDPYTVNAADGSGRAAQRFAQKSKKNKSKKYGKRQKAKRAKHARAGVDSSAGYADLVMDAKTGRVLHATNHDETRHPASLTKMMTLYLTFDALKSGQANLNQQLPVSQNASNQQPSRLGLRPGQEIRLEDALLGLVTKSANDATVVLAEAIGGSEEGFVRLMNNKARELGMSKTTFRNPSGLHDPEQVTTARDMAKLGYALVYHHPQFYPYFSREAFTYAGVRHNNHNHLMSRYEGMDGIKTGYIRASGFNLVGSTVRGSNRLIVVVFGGRSAVSRDNRMAELMDQAFARLRNENTQQRMVSTAESSSNGMGRGITEFVSVPVKAPAIAVPRHVEIRASGNS
ncbi:MAG: D-alanyl-D-alanine carboxypeptidase [Magnetococcales bacterium]|nr:D-alanyl-D-alanine carboxypeptidase [Magnetococcales bacterium]